MITTQLGNQGFVWFIGVVEDRDDPEKIGRVRVRIHHLHDPSTSVVPTENLPWASVLMPVTSSSLNGVGVSPTGIQKGSTVFGFFLDGMEANLPVIFGVLPGKGDIAKLALGQQSLNKEAYAIEPPSAFNTQYPYNKVQQTESGHVFEVDDTPNFERIHQYHRSGTYSEINQDGRQVQKIVDDNIEVVLKNKKLYVQGNVEINVKGSYTLNVDGPIVIRGTSVSINDGTQGAARIQDSVANGKIITGSGTVFIGE